MKIIVLLLVSLVGFIFSPHAYAKCSVTDKLCVMAEIKETATQIENKSWRDKVYRELAPLRAVCNRLHAWRALFYL